MEVLNNYQRKKLDESNDEDFYSDPKFVYHLDSNFRQYLSTIYKNEIQEESSVLDLMSSFFKHFQLYKVKNFLKHGINFNLLN